MDTLTIELKDRQTFRLLKNLEDMNLLSIVHSRKKVKSKTKISEQLAGSITPAQAEIMYQELEQMRGEWDRNI
jgi:ACT domain-containing protein